jgi:hypothetical protein
LYRAVNDLTRLSMEPMAGRTVTSLPGAKGELSLAAGDETATLLLPGAC